MIFRSTYSSISIPEEPLTTFLLRRAEQLADKPAVIEGLSGRKLTYAQLAYSSRAVASSLYDYGFRKGDTFAVMSPNLPEVAVAFLAVALLGGVVTPINPLYTVDELTFQLRDSGAKFLLTVPQFLDRVGEATRRSDVERVFVLGETEGATSFASLLEGNGSPPEIRIDPREDVVALLYSSGTTGLPKGVMLTHYNLISSVLTQHRALHTITEDDSLIGILPFFHVGGLVCLLLSSLHRGSTLVTLPRFDLEQFLQTLERYKITIASLVPPIVLALARHPMVEKFDLSSLKAIFCGAAPLASDVASACEERLKRPLCQVYGMTEAAGITHANADITNSVKPSTVGPSVAEVEFRIVDTETDEELGPDMQGEIRIRGPQIMKGYLNQPDATSQTIDPDGWYRTGDIGYADSDGHLFIVDRVKELIKYKGMQVAPAELEAILLTHPAIADVAVIPSPDEEAGEVPKAFVVLKSEATIDEITSFVALRVAPHKKIRSIEFIDQIPKSAAGKILRRLLVERERASRQL